MDTRYCVYLIKLNTTRKHNTLTKTSIDIRLYGGGVSTKRGEVGKTINCPLITPGQRHIMDLDSFMTIYGTFRRGDRPA